MSLSTPILLLALMQAGDVAPELPSDAELLASVARWPPSLLAAEPDGNWVLWSHLSSYLGIVDGKDSSRRSAELVDLNFRVGTEVLQVDFATSDARLDTKRGTRP